MAVPKVVSFKMNFFRIAGTSEAETLVSGKAECLLAMGKNKKGELIGETFSYKSEAIIFTFPHVDDFHFSLWCPERYKKTPPLCLIIRQHK